MTLVAEVLGVLLAGAAIAALLRSSGLASFSHTVGVAVVVTAVAAVLFAPNVWSAIRGYASSAGANGQVSGTATELAAGAGANNAFLGWAREKMVAAGAEPRFWLAPAAARADAFTYQWSTYELVPARQSDAMGNADWIVFYDVNPDLVSYNRADFATPIVYEPGFALAQRKSHG